ncbi:MAG: DUF192 domain-containing protein [Candidatus Methylacidiphilales bacterium]|nr:DUF192 domain-containing protein [Candidatus Methylacidiphilales bacterium]
MVASSSYKWPSALRQAVLAVILVLGLAACGSPSQPSSQAATTPLRTIDLTIVDQTLKTELALTPPEQEHGLMDRDSLPGDHAMLFVFDRPRRASFWMRNTRIPLSIAYLDARGAIVEIYDMQPFDETPIPSLSAEICYALEVNQGWFRRHRITPGDIVKGLEKIPSSPQ